MVLLIKGKFRAKELFIMMESLSINSKCKICWDKSILATCKLLKQGVSLKDNS